MRQTSDSRMQRGQREDQMYGNSGSTASPSLWWTPPRSRLRSPASSRTHQGRAPQASRLAADPRRRLLLCAKERLPLAHVAEGLPALEDRLRLVPEAAHRRYLGAPERRTALTLARTAWKGPQVQRGHSGLPFGQDHRSGRPRARLRPRLGSGRQEAPPVGGHRGPGIEKGFEGLDAGTLTWWLRR
jgi:hypothetical protein